MDRPALLRTGAFARASSLSVKALRLYHETGLLVPSVVDPDTGYRAYAPSQLNDAAVIRLLREVGTPLSDIGAVLDARDLGLVRKVLVEQAERLQAGLDAVERLVDDLGVDDDETDGVEVRREASRHVLAADGNPRLTELGPFAYRTEATLREAATVSGAVVDGCFGACFPAQVDDDRQMVTAFLPITEPVLVPADLRGAGVRMDELPGCDVAVLVHRGPYRGLEAAYRRLGTWVAFHAAASDLPVREWYLTPLTGPEDEAMTEVLWPVVASDPTR